MPSYVCLCKHHENPNYVLVALKSVFSVPFPCDHQQLINCLNCDTTDRDCMSPGCISCSREFKELLSSVPDEDLSKTVRYQQWSKNDLGQTVRDQCFSTVKDALAELECQYPALFIHCYIKKEQSGYFKQLMSSLPQNSILLQVDFSENFVIRHQDAIQADHWAGIHDL